MKNKLITLFLSCLLASCGISTYSVDNCIPETTFVSTKKIGFVIYRPKENFMNEAFDELSIGKTQDWYLNIRDLVNPSHTIYTEDPYIGKVISEGSKLKLSGKAKIRDA